MLIIFFQFPLPLPPVQCRPLCVCVRAAGDWGSGLGELNMYYWDEMTHSAHDEIKGGFSLAEKSDDIFDICSTISSNRACAWRHGECTGLLCCGKYQCKFMAAPRSSPIAASVTTKIKHVARFVCQCCGLFPREALQTRNCFGLDSWIVHAWEVFDSWIVPA